MILLEVQRKTPWHLEWSGSLCEKDGFSWALFEDLPEEVGVGYEVAGRACWVREMAKYRKKEEETK